MVAGIGTFASDSLNTSFVLQTKQALDQLLEQVTSGKKSLNYTGIAQVAQQALDFGNQNSAVGNFLTNNNIVNLKLNAMQTVYSAVKNEMTTFQQNVANFIDNSQAENANDVQTLQEQAFTALKNMQYYLNTQVDGQYIFSGSKTNTPPVTNNFSTLQQFQAAFDGYNIAYPTTSAADLSTTNTSVLNTGSVTFDDQAGTISAANTGQFAGLPVGSVISVTGSPFDGQYTVLANDGTTLTVSHNFTPEGDPSTNTYTTGVNISTSSQAAQDPGLSVNLTGTVFSAPGVLTSKVPGQLAQFQAGDSITITGAQNPANNGNFIVASVDPTGTTLSIQRADFGVAANLDATANPDAAASISYPTGTSSATLTDAVNGINFNANGTITDNVGGALLGAVPAGSYITVTGATQAANNGTYLVTANAAGTLSVQRTQTTTLTDEAANAAATITNGSATVFAPGSLAFTAASSVVLAGNAGSLAGMQVGQTVNIANTASNNGSDVVTKIFTTPVQDEATNGTALIVDNGAGFDSTLTGGVSFTAATNTASAANGGSLAGIQVGDVIKISGTGSNNGEFVVTANDGTNLTLAPPNTAMQVAKNVSLSNSSYYAGNTAALGQEIDTNTLLPFGVTAQDPAFEKAIRAMAMIAEGLQGTAGGLDMNVSRANSAYYLITSAIDNSAQGTPPFGKESSGNLNDLQLNLNLQQQTLNNVTTQQTNFQNFLQTAVGNLTNADPTQTIVQLLDQQSALQASYQALSTVRQLSLLNFIK